MVKFDQLAKDLETLTKHDAFPALARTAGITSVYQDVLDLLTALKGGDPAAIWAAVKKLGDDLIGPGVAQARAMLPAFNWGLLLTIIKTVIDTLLPVVPAG